MGSRHEGSFLSRRIVAALATAMLGAVAAGCSGPTSPSESNPQSDPNPQFTVLRFVSDTADFVGQGQSRELTLQNATFHPIVARSNGYLSVVVRPMGGAPPWVLIITAPTGQPIAPGTYEQVTGFETASTPGLDFGGDGRGCNRVTGRLVIRAADFGIEGVRRFHAIFEQHCEGASPALRGEIALFTDPWR